MSINEMTTEGMTPAQLDIAGAIVLGQDRLGELTPWFVGIWLDTVLLGLMLALFGHWQANVASSDRKWVKIMVYYLVTVHVGLTGMLVAWMLYMYGLGFGHYRYFLNANWTRTAYAINSFSRFPCSAFFTHRAWLMYRKNWAIPVVIAPIVAASAGCSVAVAVTYKYLPLRTVPRICIWLMMLLEIITDLILSTLLAVGLVRSKTGWKQTDRLIGRVLKLMVETQLPPTLASALFLVVTVKWGETSQAGWFLTKPKIYPVCLLIVIISRKRLNRSQQSAEAYVHESMLLSSSLGSAFPTLTKEQVRVDTVTVTTFMQQDGAFDKRQGESVNRGRIASPSDSDVSDKQVMMV